ncbi:MAG: hypothetical protein QS98_C0006G0028 [archaeon GW2011_AR3]|nr:MAG: hypothetical protein QS98_C0006G0028 [archaeon GW2011_AR3]MBS3109211.1 hypothetical protein [Candidatus Woesearchaeota archaeon]
MENRKGEMTIETLIGFALLIVVIFVVIFILMDKYDFFRQNTSCEAQGGTCQTEESCDSTRVYTGKCDSGKICCSQEIGGG